MTTLDLRLPAGARSPSARPARLPAALLAAALLLPAAAALLAPAPAAADPAYGDLLLPGFDPALAATKDPRLLGAERLRQRERLLRLGAEPLRGQSPSLDGAYREALFRDLKVDRERLETFREIAGPLGLESTFAYPKWFLLFPAAEPLPGGFNYLPPRLVDAPEVDLFLDDPGLAAERRREVNRLALRAALLDVRAAKGTRAGGEGMINLTIPIKLPRTLEKIIGKGEKTNIKITGREYIKLAGETTTTNKFLATERRSKPSLFPTLDMEQQMQVNLSGTIGEKIIVEVDYNSQAIGPEGTKIKLSYRGTEDEIIQTIETGDVGLTLPGSSLLGYSSNKSGLFGIKVTGQVGAADFTVVASKQKAESASKSFNSKGGEVSEHVIECQNYVRNRFFRLDLPPPGGVPQAGYDFPGRAAGWKIDQTSVQVYVFMPSAQPGVGIIENVAAYLDTTGLWDRELILNRPPVAQGARWQLVRDVEPLTDINTGDVIAMDLGREFDKRDLLAVYYEIFSGTERMSIGGRPGRQADRVRISETDTASYLPLKLLKPVSYEAATAHVWNYPLRNIYALGGINIDQASFDLRIEYNDNSLDRPYEDAGGLNYLQLFGLDKGSAGGGTVPDNEVDKHVPGLFDLQRGLLKFPLDVLQPFAAGQAFYEGNVKTPGAWTWEGSRLATKQVPEIYDWRTDEEDYRNYASWRLVAKHAAASGTISLGASNIEEGSETVTLDGQALTRGLDYDIDYQFGQVTLKGDAAAKLTPDSQIGVNYQYAPFMGGGNSSLLGFNLGYDLGRDSRLSTTWLYETTKIAGYKPKLGEEPGRTLVGNLNLQQTVRPAFLTRFANLLTRRDSDKESTVQIKGEAAASIPNPNTMGMAYLEDFEGIDDSDLLPISRESWYPASVPVQGRDPAFIAAAGDGRDFEARTRASTFWHIPKVIVQRRYLNPDLKEQEGREGQQVLQIYVKAADGGWQTRTWGGIMRGLGRAGINLAKAQFLEFWVNDFRTDQAVRRGRLHFDFGYLNEDFYWPAANDTGLTVGSFEYEDRDRNNIFTAEENVGLDGVAGGGDKYDATTYVEEEFYYPFINGTEANTYERQDTEDLDGDTNLDRYDGYYSIAVDLADSALVDVLRDYPPDRTVDIRNASQSWRKYRIRLSEALPVSPPGGLTPKLTEVTHVRIWYEDEELGAPAGTHLQLSEIKFLGSRWERDGIRKRLTEQVLTPAERGPDESYFIGEISNKENPDYFPPFSVREENRIPEKEQSLVIDFQNLERDHLARINRLVSPRGDNYTQYEAISWWWYNPRHEQRDLDLFFRVGSDTSNYYEVRFRFDEKPGGKTGWHQVNLGLAELTNAKLAAADPVTGWIETTVADRVTGQPYRARVVGRPDLLKVRRFYMGVVNDSRDWPVSGYFYLNDVRLEAVKREVGFSRAFGLRVNMADAIKVDFDWKKQDADFHGLNAARGQGFTSEEWSLSTSLRMDDFVPLLGWRAPVTLSRSRSVRRPKWMTNSDIEIIDPGVIANESSLGLRESYSLRLQRDPSRSALLRYVVDPWSFSLSGSRTKTDEPLRRARNGTVQGAVTYDLRIGGRYDLGRIWGLKQVPMLRDVEFLPKKISGSASFSRATQTSLVREADGRFTPRPTPAAKRGTLNGSLEWAPLPLADVSFNVRSERDLLRRREVMGLNIGEEAAFGQDVGIRFNAPKATGLPRHWALSPVRAAARALNAMRPTLNFNGKFEADRNPSLRQEGDPPNLRSLSSSGDWTLRVTVPVDRWAKSVFKEQAADAERDRLRERQRRTQGRQRRAPGDSDAPPAPAGPPGTPPPGGPGGGAAPGDAGAAGAAGGGVATGAAAAGQAAGGPEDEDLTPEERLRREQEAAAEAERAEAEALRREEREAARLAGGESPAAPDTAAADWERAGGGGSRLTPRKLVQPVLNLLRNAAPVQFSYGSNSRGAYGRYVGADDFWYRVGLRTSLEGGAEQATTVQLTDGTTLGLSTSLKLAQNVNAEMRYAETRKSQELQGLRQRNYQQDWPDLRVSISGLERWSVFGGGGGRGWFRSSNLDLGYKYSRTVNGYTATYFNPHTVTTFTPRWNVTFPSGLAGSLNLNLNKDVQVSSGARTEANRFNLGVQFRHSFRAERLLARLRLYKPGSSPSVNLDVDLSYRKDTTRHLNPGATTANAETGTSSLNFSGKFSYQITRNLSGGLHLTFMRSKNIQQDLVTRTIGLGMDATFTF